ncbi:MAG: hypothetical protein AB7U20_00545 [Planctomycetaceae bacterium]
MRPVARTLKHLLLAVLLIVAGLCMTEVGLRAHRLQDTLSGVHDAQDARLARPCPLTYQHLPFGFTGTHRSAESGAEIEVQTNSLGLRSPEVIVPKPPGRYRIVCLGDDATLAPDIIEDRTFCRLLEGILQPGFDAQVEVLNAGQPGHCPLLSLAWARTRLMGLQPDLVILCCDVTDVADDRDCRPLAKFDGKGNLLSVGHPAAKERPADWVSAVEDEFLIARLLGTRLGERLAGPSARSTGQAERGRVDEDSRAEEDGPQSALVDQTWEPLAALNAFCGQISTGFVVAVVPSSATVRSSEAAETSGAADRVGEMLRLLVERANRERIPMLDASLEFAKRDGRSRLFLSPSGALSTEGHRLFADILGQALLARGTPESTPQAFPVGGELPADSPGVQPLPTLERRPRATDRPAAGLNESPTGDHRSYFE